MPRGVFRRVFLVGRYAIKTPRFKHLLMGMRSNRWEREMWCHWQPRFRWRTLCPVLFADALGVLVVMPRALQPAPQGQVDTLPDYYPDITAESKHEDYGFLAQDLVALDYGLPYSDAVRERRAYYQRFGGRPAVEMPR